MDLLPQSEGRTSRGAGSVHGSRKVRIALWMTLGLWLCACGASRRDPMARALQSADVLWRKRATPGGLERTLQAYLDLSTERPDDPSVYWRLARVYTTMGDMDEASAVRHYGTAKEFGLRCLMLEPSFAGLVASRGGRVVPEAAAELSEQTRECLVWTVIAWSRWVRARGTSGVGLDHASVAALGARAAELAGDWGSGRGHYAHGLALALPPLVLEPDLNAAEAAFGKAIAKAPDRLTPKVDLALYVHRPLGQHRKAEALLREVIEFRIPDNDAEEMEDRHAKARARAAMGEDTEASAAGGDGVEPRPAD